jgi:hypothetical protein
MMTHNPKMTYKFSRTYNDFSTQESKFAYAMMEMAPSQESLAGKELAALLYSIITS